MIGPSATGTTRATTPPDPATGTRSMPRWAAGAPPGAMTSGVAAGSPAILQTTCNGIAIMGVRGSRTVQEGSKRAVNGGGNMGRTIRINRVVATVVMATMGTVMVEVSAIGVASAAPVASG